MQPDPLGRIMKICVLRLQGRASKVRPFFLGNSTFKRVRGTLIRISQSVKKIVSTFAILYRVSIESQHFDKNLCVEMLRPMQWGARIGSKRKKSPIFVLSTGSPA
jgi:hypothetical protein